MAKTNPPRDVVQNNETMSIQAIYCEFTIESAEEALYFVPTEKSDDSTLLYDELYKAEKVELTLTSANLGDSYPVEQAFHVGFTAESDISAAIVLSYDFKGAQYIAENTFNNVDIERINPVTIEDTSVLTEESR